MLLVAKMKDDTVTRIRERNHFMLTSDSKFEVNLLLANCKQIDNR
jgi:hypothetical protein